MIKQIYKEVGIMAHDISQNYIREATRIWDSGEAECPVFEMWIKMYVYRKWFEMVQRN